MVLGGTGYIGKRVVETLKCSGYAPICPMRTQDQNLIRFLKLSEAEAPLWDPHEEKSVKKIFSDLENIEAIISCIASRSGTHSDSWAVDHDINLRVLIEAKNNNVKKFILLSAICVQKPKLAFQQAKLAFEKKLQSSGVKFSIVRPTAFFKSLSGQINRIKKGKSFIVFDSGTNTMTKPISVKDLAQFLVNCIDDRKKTGQILKIGGPGPAYNQKQIGELIFKEAGKSPKFFYIPSFIFKILLYLLYPFGFLSKNISEKLEFLRIAYYYSTESMLVWDPTRLEYSDALTTEVGSDKIALFFRESFKKPASLEKAREQKLFN